MPRYQTMNGRHVNNSDSQRAVWYGNCGYWTDDWDLLTSVGPHIPACPKCKTPGFIGVYAGWIDGARNYDCREPGYLKALQEHKEKCYRHYPNGWGDVWEMIKDKQAETN